MALPVEHPSEKSRPTPPPPQAKSGQLQDILEITNAGDRHSREMIAEAIAAKLQVSASEASPSSEFMLDFIGQNQDLSETIRSGALDFLGKLQSVLDPQEWKQLFPYFPVVTISGKTIQIELLVAGAHGPDLPIAGQSALYWWAHGTTPAGAVQICKDRRVLRTLESTLGGGQTWGFFGMATQNEYDRLLIADKARSIGKGGYGIIVTGFLTTPRQHEKVMAGGNLEDQEAAYRAGISHRVGSHWCMREDLATIQSIKIVDTLPVTKQEFVPFHGPMSTNRS